MCGRNSLFLHASVLTDRFGCSLGREVKYRPRYNIAPGAPLEVITNESPTEIHQFQWGLLPSWANEEDVGFVNASVETATNAPVLRDAWRRRPCLVLSTGFYTWADQSHGPKRPYRVFVRGQAAFAMAGLWERTIIDNVLINSVAVLTASVTDDGFPIRDRLPVVIPSHQEQQWLIAGPSERAALCRGRSTAFLSLYEVEPLINDPTRDDPCVLRPAAFGQVHTSHENDDAYIHLHSGAEGPS